MTIDEIKQQCETLSNEQLFLVVDNKRLYNEKIVNVAYQEIRKRGLSTQEVKEIKKVNTRRARIIAGNIHEDVLFLEKVGFFFVCFLPIHRFVLRDYRKKGFVLKGWQARYYNLSGLAFLLLSIFLGEHLDSGLAGGIIWVTGFLLTHLLNEYYFKEKIIKYLTVRSGDPQ